ncbi:tail fiber assembly protein [Acerihabitans sp. TG2]|uniref:tail fiber assembly protein n=1 Tax=Acerihabitans sp. TG2 TaxID=3096008 RepID=UPI002B23A85F|nr:tail fiber assembly protein [Acerihabitans sp. TG2]MEA9389567.1 tail fiber assembly protein [Acerihabitans sp. TG2]
MDIALLDEHNIALNAGTLNVFNYHESTREYIYSSSEYLAVGVGLPANSCIDAPPGKQDGVAICRSTDFTGWEALEDHRGKTAYRIKTGKAVTVSAPGKLDTGLTLIAPATDYDKWDGKAWVTDKLAEQSAAIAQANNKRAALITEASARTQLWQTQLMLNMISESDKTLLTEWMRYIQALQTLNTASAPNITWPLSPL